MVKREGKFKYEIVKRIAVISESRDGKYKTELNLISYNDDKPKYDLRKWDYTDPNDPKLMRGLTLNSYELAKLKEAIKGVIE